MGFFDLFKQANINEGVEEYRASDGAVLVDVRTPQEYKGGHVPGSKNIPLDRLEKITSVARDKTTPLFVYCYSGARSRRAVGAFRNMGYENVKNIGGIAAYSGKVAR